MSFWQKSRQRYKKEIGEANKNTVFRLNLPQDNSSTIQIQTCFRYKEQPVFDETTYLTKEPIFHQS